MSAATSGNATATWIDGAGEMHHSGCDGQRTGADDPAVLFQAASADDVAHAIRFIAEEAENGLLQLGLVPSFSANKSEALPMFHGAAFQSARRSTLAQTQPTVEFRTLRARWSTFEWSGSTLT